METLELKYQLIGSFSFLFFLFVFFVVVVVRILIFMTGNLLL